MTTRDELRRQHLATCRADRKRLLVELASYQAGAKTHIGHGKSRTDTTTHTKSSLEAEIEQVSALIAVYEKELADV